jgi:hypothetical protein
MAILSERDAGAWRALAARVAGTIEDRLDPRVLANRAGVPGVAGPVEPVWPALSRARRLGARLPGPFRLRTDVAAFYPSITPTTLFRCLRRFGVAPHEARSAADMLEGWGSEGYPGLPIGPPLSAIVANAVLAPVDERLPDVRWFRWVDDYLFAPPSERDASRILDRIDQALDEIGLRRSETKTILVAGPSSRWPGGNSLVP